MPYVPDKPRATRRGRSNAAAAGRRVKAPLGSTGPRKGAGAPLPVTGPGKQYPGGPPAKGFGAPLGTPVAVNPGAATQQRQTSSPGQPGQVLGGTGGPSGDSYVPGQTGVHPGATPGPGLGRAAPGAARMGKRFTVGFTQDGRIVHLYGSDVPAAQRRQVLPKR